ncbi:MAG: formylglycine-generating enzyme family protein [Deltaproteobacteria bacterium]|nr:formylglycine-generating enzyme family protein [Deltaproteobacteria bacterium]
MGNLHLVEAKTLENSIGMAFVLIPAGSFVMGSPICEDCRFDDEKQHRVILTKPFYMQTTQVTQGQWTAVMKSDPPYFSSRGDRFPLEQVSWYDCQGFIRELNRMEKTNVYRLPTEAEWEYACRAGTKTPFNTGDCLSTKEANYHGKYPYGRCPDGQYRHKTVPVASLPPNAWGLYEMHGNVWEWCSDWYGEYSGHVVQDPRGPKRGTAHIHRGGSWNYCAMFCRSALRISRAPDFRADIFGFRLARDCTPTETSQHFEEREEMNQVLFYA